jgi:hypothetical protein
MPIPVSKVLRTTHRKLEREGAFDAFVDVDSKLHVDPHLLVTTEVPELKDSYSHLQKHFSGVLTLLRFSKKSDDPFYNQAWRNLTFPEVATTGLGYAKGTTRGSGIGRGLAKELVDLAKAVVDAGVIDPTIFELIGLLQDGIGADRISDMTVFIILPDLLRFTERVARNLQLATKTEVVRGESYDLPFSHSSGATVILIPQRILRHLPVADSWDDIDTVSSQNASLRARVNPLIGGTWREATTRHSKGELRATLLKHPELFEDLLEQYKDKPGTPYDFERDPAGKQLWYYLTREVLEEQPLEPPSAAPVTDTNVVEVVRTICQRFKELVESNRLYKVLYNDNGSPRPEKIAQLTFFVVADAYCSAGNLDLTPESNAGMGPVDFKMSAGYTSRVNVELKRSSHKQLVHGYEVQLPIYDAAERSIHSFFVIIRDDDNLTKIHRVQELQDAANKAGKRAPEVVVVDARPQDSASKA